MTTGENSTQPSAFQVQCEQALRRKLETLGTPISKREILWIGEVAIRMEAGHLSLWIYIDEAEIGGEGIDWRFERYGYRDSNELIEAFVAKVESLLGGGTTGG